MRVMHHQGIYSYFFSTENPWLQGELSKPLMWIMQYENYMNIMSPIISVVMYRVIQQQRKEQLDDVFYKLSEMGYPMQLA